AALEVRSELRLVGVRIRPFALSDPEILRELRDAPAIRTRIGEVTGRHYRERRCDAVRRERGDALFRLRIDALGDRAAGNEPHHRAMRDSTKSVIRLRCAAAPSIARSRSSDSALT